MKIFVFNRNTWCHIKLATVVKGNQKAPFSIATTLRCREKHYSLLLIHTLYCWVLCKEVSSTIFKVFGMMQPGIGEMPYKSKLFVLRRVTWSYNCLLKIIINYLKPYLCVQRKDYNEIESYLKLSNHWCETIQQCANYLY